MIETAVIVVPTLWVGNNPDVSGFDPSGSKQKLDFALHKKHYRVKLMNNYEYKDILFTQYVLEKGAKR